MCVSVFKSSRVHRCACLIIQAHGGVASIVFFILVIEVIFPENIGQLINSVFKYLNCDLCMRKMKKECEKIYNRWMIT